MRRRTRTLTFTVICAIVLLVGSQPAAAANYRIFSAGTDTGQSGQITGLFTYHAYAGVTAPVGSSDCSVLHAVNANAVYLTQWVVINGSEAQIEFGVGQNCGGQPGAWTYLYWGYTQNTQWNILGYETLSGPSANGYSFDIHRLGNQWHVKIDNVEKYPQVIWGVYGSYASTGIESNNTATIVPNHWFRQLQKTYNEGPWYYWSGPKGQVVDPPAMCGFFRTGTQWSGAENATCS